MKIVLEPENPRQNQRIGIKGDVSLISFKKEEDETWANHCTRTAGVARKNG